MLVHTHPNTDVASIALMSAASLCLAAPFVSSLVLPIVTFYEVCSKINASCLIMLAHNVGGGC